MSVINQVLLELEKRHASGAERGTLPDHVRALPEGGDDHRPWWIAAGSVVGIALLGMIWAAAAGYGFPRQSSPAAPSGTEAVIAKVVAASAEVDIRPREGAGDGRPDALRPAARLSLELSSPPGPDRAAQPQAETGRPQGAIPASRVLGRASTERSANGAPETATVTTAVPPSAVARDAPKAPAQAPGAADKPAAGVKAEIEKQVRQPTSRELADNEYRKGANLLQQGRLNEAQEGFRAALILHPGHHAARQAMVALMLEGKLHGDAERALQDGLKLAPEQIGFAMTLARLQVDRGDNAGAISTLQGAAGYAQGSPDYLAFLAALLQRQGRHDDAIEQFNAALRGKPNAGVWWLGLGMSLQALNRGAEAQEAYRRAKATSNLNPELAAFADQRLRQLQ